MRREWDDINADVSTNYSFFFSFLILLFVLQEIPLHISIAQTPPHQKNQVPQSVKPQFLTNMPVMSTVDPDQYNQELPPQMNNQDLPLYKNDSPQQYERRSI